MKYCPPWMTKGIIDRVSAQCAALIAPYALLSGILSIIRLLFSPGLGYILFPLNEQAAEMQLPFV
jgi:hypothetical protein